jgi:hypothetical protein
MSCIKTYSEKRFEQKSKFTLRLPKDIITVSKPDPVSGKPVNATEVIGEYFGSLSTYRTLLSLYAYNRAVVSGVAESIRKPLATQKGWKTLKGESF